MNDRLPAPDRSPVSPRPGPIRALLLALFWCLVSFPPGARASSLTVVDSTTAVRQIQEPGIRVTPIWLAAQCVPSPEWFIGSSAGTRFGLRWQVTPLLFSWGMNKRLSPWRYFIAEPYTRQSGSVELHFSPGYVHSAEAQWLWQAGVRAYLPVWQRGDYLSISLGSSYLVWGPDRSMSVDAGASALFGIIGIQVAYAPDLPSSPVIITLRLRYF